jgi:hypothetical protein
MGSEVTAPLILKQRQMEAGGEIHVPAALTGVKCPQYLLKRRLEGQQNMSD